MKRKLIKNTLWYILILIIVIPFLFPMIYILMSSFKTQIQITMLPPEWIFKPTFDNYVEVFKENQFGVYFVNSFIVATVSTGLSLLLGLPAAYSISRYNQKKLGVFILIARLMPGIAYLIPLYIIFSGMRLTDTYLSLILSHMLISLPFIVWIMINYFDNIPVVFEEAAKVDGCTRQGTFMKIILPISGPGIITGMTLSFIYSWNNFMFSLILSQEKTKTLPIAIMNFVSYAEINWGPVMAAAIVIMAPAIILTMIFQKFVIKGLTSGAVKG
jgi:multiple sugar transport system permease protein